MIQLLIIADDFTGALDTAVQLAKRHIDTLVCTEAALTSEVSPADAQVLVVNTESRHLSAGAAYDRVRRAASYAVSHGKPCQKTGLIGVAVFADLQLVKPGNPSRAHLF